MNNTTAAATKKSAGTSRASGGGSSSRRGSKKSDKASPPTGVAAGGEEGEKASPLPEVPVDVQAVGGHGEKVADGGEPAGGQDAPEGGVPTGAQGRAPFASPYSTPPPKVTSPSSGGAWSSPSGKKSLVTKTDLVPPVICDRCTTNHLVKNSAPGGKKVAFASCTDPSCAGGGIILFWSADCEFCARQIKEGTVSYSLEVAERVHANAHMHNCLRDRNEGTEDSAVAVTAAPNDVGKKCYNCCKTDPTIEVGDIIIKRKKTPFHFACSRASRKAYVKQIIAVQNDRHAKYGAKAKEEEEKHASKRKAVAVDLLWSDSE